MEHSSPKNKKLQEETFQARRKKIHSKKISCILGNGTF